MLIMFAQIRNNTQTTRRALREGSALVGVGVVCAGSQDAKKVTDVSFGRRPAEWRRPAIEAGRAANKDIPSLRVVCLVWPQSSHSDTFSLGARLFSGGGRTEGSAQVCVNTLITLDNGIASRDKSSLPAA